MWTTAYEAYLGPCKKLERWGMEKCQWDLSACKISTAVDNPDPLLIGSPVAIKRGWNALKNCLDGSHLNIFVPVNDMTMKNTPYLGAMELPFL